MLNFLKRLFQPEQGASNGPLALNLASPPLAREPSTTIPPTPEKVPGNFFYFGSALDLAIGGTVHVGFPKISVRDMTTGQVRWGDNPADLLALLQKPHLLWTDDPVRGVNGRTLENPEDVLGAAGTIGGKHVRFERILDLGRNVVVYALFCPEQNYRTAYGWGREVFQPAYVPPPRLPDDE